MISPEDDEMRRLRKKGLSEAEIKKIADEVARRLKPRNYIGFEIKPGENKIGKPHDT